MDEKTNKKIIATGIDGKIPAGKAVVDFDESTGYAVVVDVPQPKHSRQFPRFRPNLPKGVL
ncbi:MAG: hypothetical protein CMH30_00885 [Micavibrio sp.]|nr:hypothetical protein [Micavibrio sp.]|tara:strand:- start:315 stop:497 length:183 start_codon:yes stop_codon:yes gene_type:complete